MVLFFLLKYVTISLVSKSVDFTKGENSYEEYFKSN